MRFILSIVFFAISVSAWAGPTACPKHFVGGQPPHLLNEKLTAKSKELCNSGYGTLHSGITRTPLYAAEHLTRDRLDQGKGLKRISKFHADERLPRSERAELDDYARSGYDRGHVAPSGDMFDPQSQHESFALSNMIPQEPSVNRGVWERIESGIRRMVKSRGELYVVTGPLFQGGNLQQIGGRVMVPTSTFKAVYDPVRQESGAYIVENVPAAVPRVVSINELTKIAGMDVFPSVNEQVKQRAMRLPMPKPRKGKGF